MSAGTDGAVALWDITDLLHNCTHIKYVAKSTESCDGGSSNDGDSHQSKNSQGDHGDSAHDLQDDPPNIITDPDDSEYKTLVEPSVCLVDSVDLGKPLWCQQCHQSGVNAVDVKLITGDYMFIIVLHKLQLYEEF
jgi:hypothetical protein